MVLGADPECGKDLTQSEMARLEARGRGMLSPEDDFNFAKRAKLLYLIKMEPNIRAQQERPAFPDLGDNPQSGFQDKPGRFRICNRRDSVITEVKAARVLALIVDQHRSRLLAELESSMGHGEEGVVLDKDRRCRKANRLRTPAGLDRIREREFRLEISHTDLVF